MTTVKDDKALARKLQAEENRKMNNSNSNLLVVVSVATIVAFVSFLAAFVFYNRFMTQTPRVIHSIDLTNTLLVIGASGAGKSSLIRNAFNVTDDHCRKLEKLETELTQESTMGSELDVGKDQSQESYGARNATYVDHYRKIEERLKHVEDKEPLSIVSRLRIAFEIIQPGNLLGFLGGRMNTLETVRKNFYDEIAGTAIFISLFVIIFSVWIGFGVAKEKPKNQVTEDEEERQMAKKKPKRKNDRASDKPKPDL